MNVQQRKALQEQIERATRYWPALDWATRHLRADGVPTVAAYTAGVALACELVREAHDYNAGLYVVRPVRPERWKRSDGLVVFAVKNPARLLVDPPDDRAVDELVQLGIFGGLVFA